MAKSISAKNRKRLRKLKRSVNLSAKKTSKSKATHKVAKQRSDAAMQNRRFRKS